MAEIRKLPSAEPQVRTGPVRFGEDWPGIFIRGDEALALAHRLELVLVTENRVFYRRCRSKR
jgi:hypothetical protein